MTNKQMSARFLAMAKDRALGKFNNSGICSQIAFTYGMREENFISNKNNIILKKFLIEYFKPTNKEIKKYKMHNMFWLGNKSIKFKIYTVSRAFNLQSNEFRIMILLILSSKNINPDKIFFRSSSIVIGLAMGRTDSSLIGSKSLNAI